ncbi:hypothetical protein GQ53DRAFT_744557 [Thozetella sp. PMI_491]|nr:hypothetical protein GQ53DRAFT_744557 [Thozetella sp. PMI_491]
MAKATRPVDSLGDLTRLLSRLQQTVLRADAERERRLRTNEYERKKVETNIQFARSLLQKVEQDAATSSKILPRRQEWQADVGRKREILEQLAERMHDLEEIARNEADDESSDGEDILSEIIPTPSESMDSRSADAPLDGTTEERMGTEEAEAVPEAPEPASSPPPPYEDTARESPGEQVLSEKPQATAVTSHSLRPRRADPEKHAEAEKDTARTTGSELFGDRKEPLPSATLNEAILDTQRAEQDFLSESILKMARDLKDSSHAFATALEQDKDMVNSAGKGLDKNETGLEAAARRMGTLRKMTEGKGWWGRMMLYAWIYGLMVLLVLLVFVLPKLRF